MLLFDHFYKTASNVPHEILLPIYYIFVSKASIQIKVTYTYMLRLIRIVYRIDLPYLPTCISPESPFCQNQGDRHLIVGGTVAATLCWQGVSVTSLTPQAEGCVEAIERGKVDLVHLVVGHGRVSLVRGVAEQETFGTLEGRRCRFVFFFLSM